MSCRGAFTVSKGASVYLEANYQNSAPLILFNTSSSSLKIDKPKSIIFYNKSYNCLSFGNTSTFNIDCGKIDYWLTSPTLVSTGVLENNPLYTWHKSDENDGILFKVIEPLYNGETYSTEINWILSGEKLN